MEDKKIFVVPEGTKIIEFGCFIGIDVEKVVLPEGLEKIKDCGFY